MSIRLKYCKPPPESKSVEIGTKRKRGRPSKAKKALLLQLSVIYISFFFCFPVNCKKNNVVFLFFVSQI